MPMRKYFIDGMTLYKYCQVHNINYTTLSTKAHFYKVSPLEALNIHKEKGYSKLLKAYGISKDHKDFWLHWRRLVRGWDIEKSLNTPRQIGGKRTGVGRKSIDKFKIKE